jgi:hypothetical protein
MSLRLTLDAVLTCGFPLEFVRGDGPGHREPLAACAAERFEEAVPVRSFHWAKAAYHLLWRLTCCGGVS